MMFCLSIIYYMRCCSAGRYKTKSDPGSGDPWELRPLRVATPNHNTIVRLIHERRLRGIGGPPNFRWGMAHASHPSPNIFEKYRGLLLLDVRQSTKVRTD